MANALYDLGREGFLAGDIDWDGDNIKCVLVDSGYVFDGTNNDLLDIGTNYLTGGFSGNFTSKTVNSGVADAADVTISSVPASQTADAIIIYQDTGTTSTSRLIAYIDTATGLPITTNGNNIDIAWSSGANKIFKL
jgi:hypothetical protein